MNIFYETWTFIFIIKTYFCYCRLVL